MLDLSDVQAFVRVAELKGVSAAARALGAPKSSVSRSLARLEAALGVALVERSTRSVRLTDAGALFLPHARRVLSDVDEAEAAVGGFAGAASGTLRVSATFAVMQRVVAPMLPGFLGRNPGVRVVLDSGNRLVDVQAGEADVALRVGPLPDSGLVARRLATMELWACASPAYLAARGAPATVAALAGHDLVGRSAPARWTFRSATGAAEAFEFTPRAVAAEPAATAVLLAAGGGIGLLPSYLAAEAVARGELVRLFPDAASGAADLHALYHSHRGLSAKVRVFIDALVAHLRTGRAGLPLR